MSTPSSETPPSLWTRLWHHRLARFGALGLLLLGAALVTLAIFGITPAEIITWTQLRWDELNANLSGVHPAWIFVILMIVPSTPVPISPVLIACGLALRAWGLDSVSIGALVGSALFLNTAWSYWLAAGPARRLIDRLLQRSRFAIPQLGRGNAISAILLLRLTPGIPYFLHALILGFLRVPYLAYLGLSLVTTIPICVAFALLGREAAEGNFGGVLLFVLVILVFAFGSRFLYGRLSKKNPKLDAAAPVDAEGRALSPIDAEIVDERARSPRAPVTSDADDAPRASARAHESESESDASPR